MKFSITKLLSSLIDIIVKSPSSFLFIVLGIIFSVAMIINIKKNKTIGKTLYVIGWIFIIAFIIVKYNTYISKIFDNLVNNIFMQIFFPNIATYSIIIIVTNIIFLRTIFSKKSTTSSKIINTPFFIAIMVLMVFTVEVISSNNINVYQRKEVYSNGTVLTLIEGTTLLFTLWMFILLSKLSLAKLIKKNDQKKKEIKPTNVPKEVSITTNEEPLAEEIIPSLPEENTNTVDNPIVDTPLDNANTIEEQVIPTIPMENINTADNPIVDTPLENVNPIEVPVIPTVPMENTNTADNPIVDTPLDNANHIDEQVIPTVPMENINTADNPVADTPLENVNPIEVPVIPTVDNPIPNAENSNEVPAIFNSPSESTDSEEIEVLDI